MSELDSRNEDDMGKLAYNAYCDSVGWKVGDDSILPMYAELSFKARTAWIAAARAVATAVRSEQHG